MKISLFYGSKRNNSLDGSHHWTYSCIFEVVERLFSRSSKPKIVATGKLKSRILADLASGPTRSGSDERFSTIKNDISQRLDRLLEENIEKENQIKHQEDNKESRSFFQKAFLAYLP